jgi:hypothetical protein
MTGRFVPLSPPPDGLAAVLGEGRRRRRRRTAATSTAAVTSLAGVLALAVLTPGGEPDSLRPMPAVPGVLPTPVRTAAAPLPTAAAPRPGAPLPTTLVPVRPTGGQAPRTPPPAPASPAAAPSPQPRAGGYRTPDLARTYAGPPAKAGLCGAAYSNDSSTGQVGWCVIVTAERTSEGADLVVELCRDGTSAGRVSFDSDHEVDLAVLQDGRTLWQWSVGRTAGDDAHDLTAEPGGCWSWRAPWTGVDQRGEPLESGSYVLRGRSLADELVEVPPEDTGFTL